MGKKRRIVPRDVEEAKALARDAAEVVGVASATGLGGVTGGTGGAGAGAALGFLVLGPAGAAVGFLVGLTSGTLFGGAGAGLAANKIRKKLRESE